MWSGNSLAIRDAQGLALLVDLPEKAPTPSASFPAQSGSGIRVLATSVDGSKMAWADGNAVLMAEHDGEEWSKPVSFPHPRAARLLFSPLGSVLSSYETYAIRNGQVPGANVYLWDTKTKSQTPLASYVCKGVEAWNVQWAGDETMAVRPTPNSKLVVYDTSDYSKTSVPEFNTKFDSFSFSPKKKNFIIFQKGGQKKESAASFAKFFSFPNLSTPVGNKSLAFADKMEATWSTSGNAVLILATAEIDGSSYYGKQQLYYMNSKGDSVNMRTPKEGPIYNVTWSPVCDDFMVVYGFMPSKVTLYDKACNKIFDFGTGPRNVVYFNPQGTIALLGGFGNINGAVEVWDLGEKKQKIAGFEAPYTTDLKWSPDGKIFVTSTCAPRLRIGNGYKIWHYTGSLLYEKEYEKESELWEVLWKPSLKPLPAFPIATAPVKGIKSSTHVSSQQAYRPPMARDRNVPQATVPLEEKELPENEKGGGKGGAPSGGGMSKAALKNLKRREAAKKKKDEEEDAHDKSGNESKGSTNGSAAPTDVEKQLKKLNKRLARIAEYKALQADGKKLEKNQIGALNLEKDLKDQIAKLKL
eukprot:TRINITY_DN687_c0_g1_i1.p1 TRINITY_DN687_c0_g1~~TRINITY_DN687_c0_g1_i1.p1  ORF type:complete len:583 (-),score=210.39 TRINITY_DN687_c0_g1_i1:94-1842(-)